MKSVRGGAMKRGLRGALALAALLAVSLLPHGASARTEATCSSPMTVDDVTVSADRIADNGRGTCLATGHVTFDGSSTADQAVVVDPGAHVISFQASGQLSAGSRLVAKGKLSIATQGETADTLTRLAPVSGATSVDVDLSGWNFLDQLAGTKLFLVPDGVGSGAGGGVLVKGSLSLPSWISVAAGSGTLTVQVDRNGNRVVRTGHLELSKLGLPGTGWKVKDAHLDYQASGDIWNGGGTFDAEDFDLTVDPVKVIKKKVDTIRATFTCSSCKTEDDPTVGVGRLIDLKKLQLAVENLSHLNYGDGGTTAAKPCAIDLSVLPKLCALQAPRVSGEVIIGLLGDHILGSGSFSFELTGEAYLRAKVAAAPLFNGTFHFAGGSFDQAVNNAAHGIDFGNAYIHFKPPRLLTMYGDFTVPRGEWMSGSLFFGVDPPHFTAGGSVRIHIPDNSPIFPGKTIAGAEAIVSDRAAAAKATVNPCAPAFSCKIRFSGAFIWSSATFKWNVDIHDYETVDIPQSFEAMAPGVRRSLAAASPTLTVPSGWDVAVFRVLGSGGVPQVRLTAPAGGSSRRPLTFTTASAARLNPALPVVESQAGNEVTFFVGRPAAGPWKIEPLPGPAVVHATLATAGPPTKVETDPLPRIVRGQQSLGLRVANVGTPATVDVYASESAASPAGVRLSSTTLSEPGKKISALLDFPRLPTGRYHLFAVVSRDGIPVAVNPLPGTVEFVDPLGPPAPQSVAAAVQPRGVQVRWSAVPGATSYAVTATPVPDSADAPIAAAAAGTQTSALMSLPPGLRYRITVQAVADGHRSPEAPSALVAVRQPGGTPPVLAAAPPQFAEVGRKWSFSPTVVNLDGVPLKLLAVRAPAGLKVAGSTVFWTPSASQEGVQTLVLKAVPTGRGKVRASAPRTYTVFVNQSVFDQSS